MEDKLVKKESC